MVTPVESITERLARVGYDMARSRVAKRSGLEHGRATGPALRGQVPFSAPYLGRAGNDPPWLLLHSFGGDKESWYEFVGELPRKVQVLAPDFPGFGENTSIPLGEANVRGQSYFLLRFLAALHLKKVVLIGHGMGAAAALRFAQDHPQVVAGMVLLNPMLPQFYSNRTSPEECQAFAEFALSVEARLRSLPRMLQTQAISTMLRQEGKQRQEKLLWVFRNWLTAPPAEGVQERRPEMTGPVGIIYSTRDQAIPAGVALALSRAIPNAVLRELRGVGHAPHLLQPKELAAQVLEILK